MNLQRLAFSIGNSSGELTGDPSVVSHEAVELLKTALFSPEKLNLADQDYLELSWGLNEDTYCQYHLSKEEESLVFPLDSEYTSLGEFIAIWWGVTSETQLENLLVAAPRGLTETSRKYRMAISALNSRETALLQESKSQIDNDFLFSQVAEANANISRKMGESVNLAAARRLLWSQVCQLQDQLEKFAAAMKGIAGSPVKPEQIEEVRQVRSQIEEVDRRISGIKKESELLDPKARWYKAGLALIFTGLTLLILPMAGWFLGLTPLYLSLSISGLGLMGGMAGSVLFGRTKPDADRYYDLQDELLDRKTELRRARKMLKNVLAGEKEEELWSRVTAQQEADRIRGELEYKLDRFTKAWQKRSNREVQAGIGERIEAVSSLMVDAGFPQLAKEWQNYWQDRQNLLAQLEPASFREKWWNIDKEGNQEFDAVVSDFREFLCPPSAPVFIHEEVRSMLASALEDRQLLVVR